jgi:hypothetical protein
MLAKQCKIATHMLPSGQLSGGAVFIVETRVNKTLTYLRRQNDGLGAVPLGERKVVEIISIEQRLNRSSQK